MESTSRTSSRSSPQVTMALATKFKADFLQRVEAVLLTDSVHGQSMTS